MRTNELKGAALDWAVSKCEGNEIVIRKGYLWIPTECYSTDWAQGGPIIERERLEIAAIDHDFDDDSWASYTEDGRHAMYAEEPLVAAMRCYVISKLGANIDIPRELLCEH